MRAFGSRLAVACALVIGACAHEHADTAPPALVATVPCRDIEGPIERLLRAGKEHDASTARDALLAILASMRTHPVVSCSGDGWSIDVIRLPDAHRKGWR